MKNPQRLLVFVLILGLGAVFLAVRDRASAVQKTEASSAAALDVDGRVDFTVDSQRQQLIGVRTVRVTSGALVSTLSAAGTVRFDETRLTDVNVKIDGWIADLLVNSVGQPVTRGQALFTLFSPELLDAQNELLLGLKNRDQLTQSGAVNAREFTQRVVDVPRQKLIRWDVPADEVRSIEETRQPKSSIEFQSPTNGVVIEKRVVKGMHVERGQTLYRLADVSVVWVEADFHEMDLSRLRVGANAGVTADAWPGETMQGRIERVYPFLSESTRTVRARLSLDNRHGRLKPGMFVRVDVSATNGAGLLVPADAIVDSGSRHIVFVAQGDGRFEPHDVTVGLRNDEQSVVLTGLNEHDEVVARAALFLDSESKVRSTLEDDKTQQSGVTSGTPVPFDLSMMTIPAPPRTGENIVEVHLQDAEARAVTDANIRILFSMSSMPSMNMPAMRAEGRLTHVKDGIYRGSVTLPMRGVWNVTVTALRQGRSIAESRTSLMVQ